MAKKKSGKLAKAVEAFGELPSDVRELGKPLSVHPMSRYGEGMPPSQQRLAGYLVAACLVVAGCVFLVLYSNKTPMGKGTHQGWLFTAIASFVFAVVSAVGGWFAGREPDREALNDVRGIILYPDAIVEIRFHNTQIIRWADVKELHSPGSKTLWTVVSHDGREIQLPDWVSDQSDAIINICKCVEAVFLPRYLAILEQGKRVMFGKFGVSKRFVYSKEDKLAWEDVTRLEVVNGRLHVRRGGLLPWADYNLMDVPNGFLAHDLVRRLAPPGLLVANSGRPSY